EITHVLALRRHPSDTTRARTNAQRMKVRVLIALERSATLRPNGSRLSCGASAGGRKRPALRYRKVGAQRHASFESRPRQLQALVRPLKIGRASCRERG